MTTHLQLVRTIEPPVLEHDPNLLPTFLDLFNLYLDRKKDKLKATTVKGYKQAVRTDLSDWHDLQLDEITRKRVADRHAEISDKNSVYGKGKGQADHVFRLVRALLNYAMAYYRDLEDQPVLKANACDVLKETRSWNKQRGRTNYLKDEQLAIFWKATAESPYLAVRDWLRFTLLTGFRKDEGRKLKWENVDFENALIRLSDTKSNREHVFPLSNYLLAFLRTRRQYCPPNVEYVFSHPDGSNSPLPYNTRRPDEISAASGLYFTLHDLRRTFVQACLSCELSEFAIKALVNHSAHDVTGKHYLGGQNLTALRSPIERVTRFLLRGAVGDARRNADRTPRSNTKSIQERAEQVKLIGAPSKVLVKRARKRRRLFTSYKPEVR